MHETDEAIPVREDQTPPRIRFQEEPHLYFVDGLELPSVSAIMRPLSEQYYANLNSAVVQNAAERGKAVHRAIEDFEKMGVVPIDPELVNYWKSYVVAKKLHDIKPIDIEKMLTNGVFCGTLDQIALVKGALCIVDLKATSAINTILLEVQLAGYLELARANGYEITQTYVLHLKKDGFKFKAIEPNFPLWNRLKELYGCG